MNAEQNKPTFKDRLPWIVAAVAVVALAANLLWDRKGGNDGDDKTIAQLTERLDALEGDRGAAARRGLPPGMSAGTGAPRDAAGMLGQMREPKTPEQVEAEREQQLRELEAQFARDVADPVTGPQTENTLVETISGETMAGTGLKPNDVDIACKKNSCRIVGTFDKMGDAQDWSLFYITAAGGNVLSQTRMVFVPKPGGRTEVRIYSNRAGG